MTALITVSSRATALDHGDFWFLHCRQKVISLWIQWHDDFSMIIEKKDLPGRNRGVFYWWMDGSFPDESGEVVEYFYCIHTFSLDSVEVEWTTSLQ